MEDIKRRFANEVAAKLAAAPESDAKSEMIEELAENLARRYEDMLAVGVDEDTAFARAMEQLGDVDELEAYLASQEPADGADGGRDDADSFFQSMGSMAREVADMGKQIAQMAGEFFRSDTVRGAAEEGRKAARAAGEVLKSVAGAAWEGAAVHIHVDDDGTVTGKAKNFGWTDGGEEQGVPSQGVLRLDVETAGGDVDVFLDDDPDSPVLVEGNMSRLAVGVTEDGVLTVRPRPTASNQFFSFRGAFGQDVSLTIPTRRWESIRIVTSNGDVDMGEADMDSGLEVGQLIVQTASGDIDCRVKSCERAELKTASGDVQLEGNAAALHIETASGDVSLNGPMGEAEASTASGDVELSGSVWKAHIKSMSGDIRVESKTLPDQMELSSKSGDVGARVPDNGPFKVRISSVSGTVDLRPFEQWSWSGTADPNAPVPQYTLTSISGDVTLEKY